MSPGDGRSSHPSVGFLIMRLYDVSLTFNNVFVLLHQGACSRIFFVSFL